jgi:hypothetical protein
MPVHIYTPFTYLIGWKDINRWYYGVRYARGCHPDDLWTKYFTSSKIVQEYREKYGEPDVIKVRETFPTDTLAREWEHKVLRRMNVVKDVRWINRCQGKTPSRLGYKTSEETKQKMSIAAKGKHRESYPHSEETKQKMRKPKSDTHKENIKLARLGHPHSEETRAKFRNRIVSEQTRKKIGSAHKGIFLSEEHKRKISESMKKYRATH